VDDDKALTLQLNGYVKPGQGLHRNVLFDQLYASLPKDPQVKVQIYNAEIAPGGYTNWHCHNGATFFVALQGIFEAEFQEGILIRAKAGGLWLIMFRLRALAKPGDVIETAGGVMSIGPFLAMTSSRFCSGSCC